VFANTENIRAYLSACQQLGVNQADMFEVHDLLQYGDVQQVLRNIVALERAVVARGFVGPKLELVDKCEREDCNNKIDGLLGEVGSLKRQLHDGEEDNRELRQENQDYLNKIAAKDEELVQLRVKMQSVEASTGVLAEKYKLATIDLQIVKQDYDQLLKQHEELKLALATNSVNNVFVSRIDDTKGNRASISVARPDFKIGGIVAAQQRTMSTSSDGLKKNSVLNFFRKSPSSPDLKKLEEMRKFIKKEKKEILRQEKEKKKQEMQQNEAKEDDRPKLTKALRSLTQHKFAAKNKEKRQTISKENFQQDAVTISNKLAKTSALRPTQSVGTIKEVDHSITQPSSPTASRERSATAAGRLVSLFKPNAEGNNTTSAAISIA